MKFNSLETGQQILAALDRALDQLPQGFIEETGLDPKGLIHVADTLGGEFGMKASNVLTFVMVGYHLAAMQKERDEIEQ